MYVGDTYILENDTIVAIFEGVKVEVLTLLAGMA
jgi:hypothetical protein